MVHSTDATISGTKTEKHFAVNGRENERGKRNGTELNPCMTRINRHRRSLPRSICRLPQDSFPHLASIHPGCRAIRAPFEPKRSRFQSVPTPSTTDPFSVPYLNTFGGPFINTLNNRPTSPYNHHCSGAVALLPPVRRSSFPSPFRIRSCTRTKKPPSPSHTTTAAAATAEDRVTAVLPSCLPACLPPRLNVRYRRCEARPGENRREENMRREENPQLIPTFIWI